LARADDDRVGIAVRGEVAPAVAKPTLRTSRFLHFFGAGIAIVSHAFSHRSGA
jgi:hypothetical protein